MDPEERNISRFRAIGYPSSSAHDAILAEPDHSQEESMSPRSCAKTALLSLVAMAHGIYPAARATEVSVCTDVGNLVIALDDEKAPLHAANFLEYVDRGYYSGTVFHRVIPGFMIQGGGFDRQLAEKATLDNVENESRNGLSNLRGTIAAARTSDPHSARAQFFINLVDNKRLDGSASEWGYTVFGRVIEGMDNVDAIAALPTSGSGPFAADVPDPLIGVRSMARLDREALAQIPETQRETTIRDKIEAAYAEGDMNSAMTWIGHYRASCNSMDSELLIIEANVAFGMARAARAKAALDEYFAITPQSHESYQAAIALYAKIAPGQTPNVARQIGKCVAPNVPAVPDGSSEELEGMLQGQDRVQAFMRDSTAYLECLDDFIDDRRSEEADKAAALNEYNRMVDITQRLGDDFNEQVRAFRARD